MQEKQINKILSNNYKVIIEPIDFLIQKNADS